MKNQIRFALLAILPVVSACDDETRLPPEPDAGTMFARYAAMGNSITAGFQSGGIAPATQRSSYAVLLATQMGHTVGGTFKLPLLNDPGCPPLLTNILTGERVGGGTSTTCGLRAAPIPTFINNVAVPGAEVIDALDNLDAASNANALTTFILGGRTQVDVVAGLRPTFVSVWLGSNDVLGAALARDASLATSVADFTTRYDELLADLDAMNVEGGVLFGVPNVTTIPHFNPGQFYFGLKQANQLPPNYTVQNCQPSSAGGVGDVTFVPFSYGFGVLAAQAATGAAVTLDCTDGTQVLTLSELGAIGTAVAGYNAAIRNAASARQWAFVNVDSILTAEQAAGNIPLVPDLTDPTGDPFGPFFSLDGIHPSDAAHKIIANAAIAAVNARYATTIPAVP